MPSMPSYDPFANYAPRPYCPDIGTVVDNGHCRNDVIVVPAPFMPTVSVHTAGKNRVTPTAYAGDCSYPLGDIRDLLSWKGDAHSFVGQFQGRVGERLLSLLLECFVNKLVVDAKDAGYETANGNVLREKRKYRTGRGDAVFWDNEYLLKFDRRTTFVLLQKAHAGSYRFRYRKGELSLERAEIDGLAYFTVNDRKYLLVGDAKTISRPSSDVWNINRPGNNLETRLVRPLRELYPDHELVYVVAAYRHMLFQREGNPPVLTPPSEVFAHHLRRAGVTPVFIPFPEAIDCKKIARQFHGKLLVVRSLIESLENMIRGDVRPE
ncbi:MAG: hypothetical protein Q7R76_04320 [Candidatus Woesearchaeota archaeon]|nr:hypothetical protein [Candidatus Woesearchaeota archaeon]